MAGRRQLYGLMVCGGDASVGDIPCLFIQFRNLCCKNIACLFNQLKCVHAMHDVKLHCIYLFVYLFIYLFPIFIIITYLLFLFFVVFIYLLLICVYYASYITFICYINACRLPKQIMNK